MNFSNVIGFIMIAIISLALIFFVILLVGTFVAEIGGKLHSYEKAVKCYDKYGSEIINQTCKETSVCSEKSRLTIFDVCEDKENEQ